jgi:hypothetical protein
VRQAHLLIGDVDRAAKVRGSSALAADVNADSCRQRVGAGPVGHGRGRYGGGRYRKGVQAIEEHRMQDYAICLLASAAAARLPYTEAIEEANASSRRRCGPPRPRS